MEVAATARKPEINVERQQRADDIALARRLAESQRSNTERALDEEKRAKTTPSLNALREEFRESLRSANERLESKGREVRVGVDQSTNTFIVTVTDRESGETVRQIPPEAAVRISRNIDQLTGIFVDQKA
jgi:uncharacterized FlaG/YvyC family protein